MDILIDNIKLSNSSKEQLIKMKKITGVENWNILCRWAFCLSLSEKEDPKLLKIPADSNVEMTWKTFAGEYSEFYYGLLMQRAINTRIEITKENMIKLLRIHISRGLSYLIARRDISDIASLLRLVKNTNDKIL